MDLEDAHPGMYTSVSRYVDTVSAADIFEDDSSELWWEL